MPGAWGMALAVLAFTMTHVRGDDTCLWGQRGASDQQTNFLPLAPPLSVTGTPTKQALPQVMLNTPVLSSNGSRAVFGDSSGRIYGFDVASGSIAWTVRAGGEVTSTCSIVQLAARAGAPARELALCPARDMRLHAIDVDSGEEVWTYAGAAVFDVAAPLVCAVDGVDSDALVWLVTLDARLHCVNAANGTRLSRTLIHSTAFTDTGVHPSSLTGASCAKFAVAANSVGAPASGGHWRDSAIALYTLQGVPVGSTGGVITHLGQVPSSVLVGAFGQVQPIIVAPRKPTTSPASRLYVTTRSEASINSGRVYALQESGGNLTVAWMQEFPEFLNAPAFEPATGALVVFGDTFVSTVDATLNVRVIATETAGSGTPGTTLATYSAASKWNPTQYDIAATTTAEGGVLVPSSSGCLHILRYAAPAAGQASGSLTKQSVWCVDGGEPTTGTTPLIAQVPLVQPNIALVSSAEGALRVLPLSRSKCEEAAACPCGDGKGDEVDAGALTGVVAPVWLVLAAALLALMRG